MTCCRIIYMPEKQYKIGLVLSGGGTRGFAHLGVIKALNEAGIYPDVISGTSSGALAGVMYADGYTPEQIMNLMKVSSRLDIMKPALPREGLLQLGGVIKIIKSSLRAKTFEDLKIPMYVSATDLNNGKAVYFSEGELIEPLIASASLPVIFQPVIINDICYVDGGIMDNLPIRPIEDKCRIIIGSFVNPIGYLDKIKGLISIAERTLMISMVKELSEKSKKFDLFVAPAELKNHGILNPEKADLLFSIGYDATREKLKESGVEKLLIS
jgi:NTE family protein